MYSVVMPEPGEPLAPPIFCRSVNPTETGEGRFPPPITGAPYVVRPARPRSYLDFEK